MSKGDTMLRKGLLGAGLLMMVAVTAAMAQAPASENDDLMMSVEALKTRNRDLERRLTELEARMGEGADTQRLRREEINTLINQAMADSKDKFAPGWLDNLKFSGDLRLRYEHRDKTSDNLRDNRARARLRFGFEKAWTDQDMLVGFRLATGDSNDPTSTNQTFIGFRKYDVWVDRAYAQWTPKAVKGLSVTAGKMANPWETSDLVWDGDVNPDGVWVRYNVPVQGPVTPFIGAGAFQLFTSDSQKDASLKAFDAGIRYQIAKGVKWTSAVTFYNYTNIDSAFVNGAIINRGGNTVVGGHLVSDYNTLDFTNKIDFIAFGLPMNVFLDWAHNTSSENLDSEQLDGLAAGIKVGANKKKGDWSAWYVWKNLESDAVLASFAESDFGWNTFTNRRGSQFGVAYNLTDSMTAGVTLFITEPIRAPNETERFTLQADLVWKF